MPVDITPADSTIWRTAPYSNRAWFWVYSPVPVFQARVNLPSAAYPVSAITYDTVTLGDYLSIRPDMTVTVGTAPGKRDLGMQRVRTNATASAIPVGWSSAGKHEGELYLADDAYITVWDDYRVHGISPRILNSGQTFKDYNRQLGVNGIHLKPVANAGPPICEYLERGETSVTVTLDASRSFATTPGIEIVDYLWEIPGQDNIITETAEVTFAEGFRWVHLTVHDENGQSHTAHLPVLVASAETAGMIKNFEMTRTLTAQGQTASFTVRQPIPLDTYPDGTMVLYWEEERYRGTPHRLTGTRRNVKFYGWIATNTDSIRVNETTMARENVTTLDCVDVAGRLALLPGFPQVLEKKTTPITWQHIRYANINFYIHYLLLWHSTALALADFYFGWQATGYPFPVLDSDGALLYQQADGRAKAIAHRLTCDSAGTLRIVGDPQEQRQVDRTNTVMMALNASDYKLVGYTRMGNPRLHWFEGAAIISNSQDASLASVVPVFSIAPGQAPGQGGSTGQRNYQLVKSQAELNERTGHQYARANATHSAITIDLVRKGDAGLEPAFCEWITLNIPARVAAPRGDTMTGSRHLPVSVTYTRNNEIASQTVSMTVEEEVIGTPAQTFIPDKITYPPYELPELVIYPIPDWDLYVIVPDDSLEDLLEETPVEPAHVGVALTWNDEGSIALTDTFLEEEVIWLNIRDNSSGVVVDACGNYDTDNTHYNIRILTRDADGVTGRIYRREVLNEQDWTIEHTFTFTGTNPRITEARLRCNRANTLFAVAWLAEDGVRCIRRTTGAWGSVVVVGNTGTADPDIHDKSLGLQVEDNLVLACGRDGSGDYKLYKASGLAGTFSLLGSGGLFDTVITALNTGPGGYAYAGSWSADYTVVPRAEDWDESGFLLTKTILGSNPTAQFYEGAMMISAAPELPANSYMHGKWVFDSSRQTLKDLGITFHMSRVKAGVLGISDIHLTIDVLIQTEEGGTHVVSRTEVITGELSGPTFGFYSVDWYTSLSDGIDIAGETLTSMEIRVSVAEEFQASTGVALNMEVYGFIEWDDFVPDKNRLWRIADYTGSAAWTDILDSDKNAPYHPYGLMTNLLQPQTLVLAGGRKGEPLYDGTPVLMSILLESLTRGSTWNYFFTGYNWAVGGGDIMIAGGENTLDMFCPVLSLVDRFNRLGNYIDVAGYPGKMRGCLMALIPTE